MRQAVAVTQLHERGDRQPVSPLRVRRRQPASVDALQRLLEAAERQQLLAEPETTVDQLRAYALEVGLEPDCRLEVGDRVATPERHRVLQPFERVAVMPVRLSLADDEAAERPEIDVDPRWSGEPDSFAIGTKKPMRGGPARIEQAPKPGQGGSETLAGAVEVGVRPDDVDDLIAPQRPADGE